MTEHSAIEPDTKDWTWVLNEVCPECGFEAASFPVEDVASYIRENAAAWGDVLAGPEGEVRRRPSPAIWSPLEYGCHVRDVLRLYDHRLVLMLTQDDPLYPNWDQDETAVADRYGEQDPAPGLRRARRGRHHVGRPLRRARRGPVAAHRPPQRRRILHGGLLLPLLPARRRPPLMGRHVSTIEQ